VIDLHSHVLPGLDDGAGDLEEALAICRAAAADGIEAIAGTPHVRHDHGTTAESMEAARHAIRGLYEASAAKGKLSEDAQAVKSSRTAPHTQKGAWHFRGKVPGTFSSLFVRLPNRISLMTV